MTPARQFHPALEALRGLAALTVVLLHCALCWSVAAADSPAASLVSAALLVALSRDAPVVLFFVLSGFVLSGALSRLGGVSRGSMAAYAARRLCRIVPVAWAALLITIAVLAVCSRWPDAFSGTDYWLTDYLGSASLENLARSLLFVDDPINPMYWSLHVELVGSALMPVLYGCMRGRKSPLWLVAAATLLILLPLAPYRFGPLSHLSSAFLFCFAFGALAFQLVANHAAAARRWLSIPSGICAAALLVLAHNLLGPAAAFGPVFGHSEWLAPILGDGANIDLHAQHLLEAGASAILVGSIAAHPGRWSMLHQPALRFAGRISYSLYVVHYPVIVASVVLLATLPVTHSWLAPFVTMVLVLPASIAAAWLLHVAIENPGMALGRPTAAATNSSTS